MGQPVRRRVEGDEGLYFLAKVKASPGEKEKQKQQLLLVEEEGKKGGNSQASRNGYSNFQMSSRL